MGKLKFIAKYVHQYRYSGIQFMELYDRAVELYEKEHKLKTENGIDIRKWILFRNKFNRFEPTD